MTVFNLSLGFILSNLQRQDQWSDNFVSVPLQGSHAVSFEESGWIKVWLACKRTASFQEGPLLVLVNLTVAPNWSYRFLKGIAWCKAQTWNMSGSHWHLIRTVRNGISTSEYPAVQDVTDLTFHSYLLAQANENKTWKPDLTCQDSSKLSGFAVFVFICSEFNRMITAEFKSHWGMDEILPSFSLYK